MAATALTVELDDIQGLVASAYGHLPRASFLLLEIADPHAARARIARLADEVTTAAGRVEGSCVNFALTPSGLQKLGVSPSALDGFSREFRDGMTEPSRARVLGDTGENAPAYWEWGAMPADALLLVYGASQGLLSRAVTRYAKLDGSGLRELRGLDARREDREHFGFRDGISQPVVAGLSKGAASQAVATGEFVLGYPNEYGQFTARPLLDPREDPGGLLPVDPQGSGRRDLGRNGSYLVLRQLAQDVPAFWAHLEHVAAAGANGYADPTTLAARMVGRWPSGAPLVLSPDHDDPSLGNANEFGYHATDRLGLRCPIGAHMRRAHPRDSLDPSPGSRASVAIDRRHRLLRRGRNYGPRLDRAALADGRGPDALPERGLQFMALCANLARQFEFVQHTWVNNPNFDGLYEDPDPLLGPPGRVFTINSRPTRRRLSGLPGFVRVRGGGYFFLPGIRALRWLGSV